jgi:hypothetical protein
MTKRLAIELDDEVHEKLMKLSKRAQLSPSGLIRDLLNVTYERTWTRRPKAPVPPPEKPIDEVTAARARKALRDRGLLPSKPRKPTKR